MSIRHTVAIQDTTYNRIIQRGRFGESFSQVLDRILDVVEEKILMFLAWSSRTINRQKLTNSKDPDKIIEILQNYSKLLEGKIAQAKAGSKSLNSVADIADNGDLQHD